MIKKTASGAGSCPVTFALETFGDRWTLLVLREVVLRGHYRFSELLDANPGLATNILSDRLQRLLLRGLVEKSSDPQDARRFLYKPTDLGISLIPMLLEMIVWGAEHRDDGPGGAKEKSLIRRFKSDRGKLIEELRSEARRMAEEQ